MMFLWASDVWPSLFHLLIHLSSSVIHHSWSRSLRLSLPSFFLNSCLHVKSRHFQLNACRSWILQYQIGWVQIFKWRSQLIKITWTFIKSPSLVTLIYSAVTWIRFFLWIWWTFLIKADVCGAYTYTWNHVISH